MGLKDFRAPTETLSIPGGELTLRGLTLPDITAVALLNGPGISALVEEITMAAQLAEGEVSFKDIAMRVMTVAQGLPGYLIAFATSEPELHEIANQLPFPIQVMALERIIALTFTGDQTLQSFAETVIRIASGMTASLASLNSPSPSKVGD